MSTSKFNDAQMKELVKGARSGIDISVFRNSQLSAEQMKQIRLGAEQGLDVSKYAFPYFNAGVMKQMRLALLDGVENFDVLSVREGPNFNAEQAKEIRLGLERNLNVNVYANSELDAEQMKQIRLGLTQQLPVEMYATTDFSSVQMKQLRIELMVHRIIEEIKQKFAELWEKIKAGAKEAVSADEIVNPTEETEKEKIDILINKAVENKIANLLVVKCYENEEKFNSMSLMDKIEAIRNDLSKSAEEQQAQTQEQEISEEAEM